jgi:hypothetical protein
MNNMGAHYNHVSISIVNSDSKIALGSGWSYNATCAGLYTMMYTMYNRALLCGKESCGCCTQIQEQIDVKNGTFKNRLASDDAIHSFFLLLKPSSDNPFHFFSWGREKFGTDEDSLRSQFKCSSARPAGIIYHVSFVRFLPPGPT